MVDRIVAIIQARMAASRLPGKVLLDLAGRPVLSWVVSRTRRSNMLADVVVATTGDPGDDVVAEFCLREGILFSRGSMHDVLDRYFQAAKRFNARIVVRITADCPFIDPVEIDRLITYFLAADPPLDFAANRLPMHRTIPIGLDVEMCTFGALETAWLEAKEPHQREHVMPFFYENTDRFNTLHLEHEPDFGSFRWTLDTREDLELVRRIAAHFAPRDDFGWQEIVSLVEAHPELTAINANVRHKEYREVDDRP